jgi:site-specific DNA recombinase
MDDDIVNLIVAALKESHADEQKYHADCIASLQNQYEKLQLRLDGMYEDKLDGIIDQPFYDRKSSEWREKQIDLIRKIEQHQRADRSYIDDGVKLVELAQRAVMLYENQNLEKKRQLINFLCSNSIWKNGKLYPNHRQPFNILAENNIAYQNKKATFPQKNDLFDFWLPSTDSNRGLGG